jgi:2-polyprenyl-6-methoxyphenol hydroxylase-like FAD-dependent oxidoreductase
VTLAGGEVLSAHVVIGADGTSGLSRQLLEDEEAGPPNMNLYRSASILDWLLIISFIFKYGRTQEIDYGKSGFTLFL